MAEITEQNAAAELDVEEALAYDIMLVGSPSTY